MKTIIILLMIFGLYACDESTVTQPKDDTKVEIQKYTLEEILADPNWVEITDTVSINLCLVSGDNIFELISNENDYFTNWSKNKERNTVYEDSTNIDSVQNPCYKYEPSNIDFNNYFLTYHSKIITGQLFSKIIKIFYNNKIKAICYYYKYTSDERLYLNSYSTEFIKMPKLQIDEKYIIYKKINKDD